MSDTNRFLADSSQIKVRLLWAGTCISGLVVTDLVLKLLCTSWLLLAYIVFGGVGFGLGGWLHRRFSGASIGAKILRRGARVLSLLSAVGIVVLFVMPVSWDTKCSWRYCGRALGPGLFQSPFSVGTPTCGGWNKCVNEYSYSDVEYAKVLRRMQKQDCPAP